MADTRRPVVTGPVTGGRGVPYYRQAVDLAAYDYVEEEYFLEGEAERYVPAPGAEIGRDGHWQAEPVGSAPYKTRIVVYRPADPEKFSGTVFVCWTNVSAGSDTIDGLTVEMLESGCAAVGVSAQPGGVRGVPETRAGLVDWDPERYGALSVPGDDYSFDIFSQAGRAIGPERDRSVDPMGGLPVRNLIAHGSSQSAGRLGAYINAVHPLAHVYDGFVLRLYFGTGTPLEVGDQIATLGGATHAKPGANSAENLIRDDLDVPVMIVNSELEALACRNVRQPDTDRFRWWEVTGSSHVAEQGIKRSIELGRRSSVAVTPGMNRVPIAPVDDAAYHHMAAWVDSGTLPPIAPRIEFDNETIVRDQIGIAEGGIRLPQVRVPLARHDAIPLGDDWLSFVAGSSHPLSAAGILAMYGDEQTYMARFEEAAREAVAAGVLLERDVPALVAEARDDFRRLSGQVVA
ncbi:hypothetical protein NONO_c50430 [Nocardia nova SH22a]|uniref:Alpha/beta hydrolase domain-containing protein n=1 Tax=Nocardia nova SH22a TaxID=1415166 RepID=W5TKQ0_9NOCA|nr:alpha/beta hydrolase domain-containing protein [Nocardia nova]AHH19827.1 hypothetical protein NONO_c50430 [Nocardia nova SH22a]